MNWGRALFAKIRGVSGSNRAQHGDMKSAAESGHVFSIGRMDRQGLMLDPVSERLRLIEAIKAEKLNSHRRAEMIGRLRYLTTEALRRE